MAIQPLDSAVRVFKGGLTGMARYAWILIPIVVILGVGGIAFWLKKVRDKKNQWTHTLKVRRVIDGNRVTEPVYHKMRRFPLIKKAEVFELEKPLLGGYLIPELDEYTGVNEFSIILDKNNRIYQCKGDYFYPDKNSVNVSARHAEIDIQRSNLKADFQNINKVSKRIEWSEIAKYAFMILGLLCLTIIGIVGLQRWGEAQEYKAQEAQAMEAAMRSLETAMTSVAATVNTQKLEILPLLEEIYDSKNLQGLINKEIVLNGTPT